MATTKEFARRWGISVCRVSTLCKNKRILGAYLNGRDWWIPPNAPDPRMPIGYPLGKERKRKVVSDEHRGKRRGKGTKD